MAVLALKTISTKRESTVSIAVLQWQIEACRMREAMILPFPTRFPVRKAVALFRWHTIIDIRPKAMVHASMTLPTAETARSALLRDGKPGVG